MLWVTLDGMEHHWERARVNADIVSDHEIQVTTDNATALTLSMPPGLCPLDPTRHPVVRIDGRKLEAPKPGSDRSWTARFQKSGARWTLCESDSPWPGQLKKRHGLQGPIDDAFTDSFLMVKPTGRPFHAVAGQWTIAEFSRATNEWRRQFRGLARVKDDTQVTEADIRDHHLVLWGDPSSNRLLARIADQLPLGWNAEKIQLGSKAYDAAHHAPVLVYPNPLHPARYVVINSGFTFREYDYLNNARQVPKLPDFAVINLETPPSARAPGDIVAAGFFDENWRLSAETR
jgi:hypothetical protein